MKYTTLLISAATALLLLSGCESKDGMSNLDDTIAGYAVFDPSTGSIPYPNNILFAPNSSSTNDFDGMKTLNIPYEPTDADAGIKEQLNELTGFSTTSPITAPVSATLDTSTMPAGVQLYEVSIDPATGTVTAVSATLTFGVDFIATQSGSNIVILPLKPLKSLTTYMVVLTDALKDSSGRSLAPDIPTALTLGDVPIKEGGAFDAETAAALEQIRQGNQAMFAALKADGKEPGSTVQIWNFRTQMIGAIQANLAASAPKAAVLALNNKGFDTVAALGLAPSGHARIYDGNLSNLVQYMPQPTSIDPTNALKGEFSLNDTMAPQPEANIVVPVVAFIPNADSGCGAMPTDGWPVVIYQHGITRQRTDLFVFGETLASSPVCHAAVAMDLPLHGVTDSANPFYKAGMERTYDLDLVTQDADGNVIAKGSDGITDSSGTFYMNLEHILTTRDNMHQTTSDLLELKASLASANLDNNTSLKFDASRVSFLSHSLGTIASIGFVNENDASTMETATLAMPGQKVIDIIRYSPVFSPAINAGLAAAGIIEGTPEYEGFMLASQTLVDDADPANYTMEIGQKNLPILEIEAVGDGLAGSGDQHILNSIPTSPMAGTEPFIYFTGATDINTSGVSMGDVLPLTTTKTVLRLTAGEHRSPLDPQYSAEATATIHTAAASFISSKGAAIQVAYPSIIKQ